MIPETVVLADGSQVTLIHFVNGAGCIACMPGLKNLSASSGVNQQRLTPHLRSGETGAVTCPTCKKTPDYTGAEVGLRNALARNKK